MVQFQGKSGAVGGELIHMVTLDKTGKKSFGICIVRGEVKDSPNTKTTGIFIKGIVPDSPAHSCGRLKVGDRILSLNGKDVRHSTEQAVIDLIKEADFKIDLEIQTYDKSEEQSKQNDPRSNGYMQAKNKFHQEQAPINTMGMGQNQNQSQGQGMGMGMNRQPTMQKRNQTFTASMRNKHAASNYADEDDEDTRDMTGRIRTEAGYEIDRASAGNCKLNKQEKERDKEQEDEFGYTMAKINKRYNMMKDLRRIEVQRAASKPLGIALAGHKDRQKMACFVAGVDTNGTFASVDFKAGDEIVEVNGNVLKNRCHLNASAIFKNVEGEKLVLITSRRKPNDEGMCVKPIKKFPASCDETKFIFDQYPKARSVQVRKEGFLGIMVIYGKHVEVGSGIFISDLREGSNAEAAGVKVGDMLLAINQDVTMESNYDEATGLIKRAEGVVTMILLTLKSEESIRAEKEAEDKKKEEAKKEAEKPQEPATAEIKPNKKILIEVKVEKKPLGVIVTGGKNNHVKTGCVITHIYPEGAVAADNRLKIFDHITDVNGGPVHVGSMTTLKVHQLFHVTYERCVNLTVFRADPPELEKFNVDFMKKAGKELGLSLAPNELGCTIADIVPGQYPEIDSKLQRGDIISKLNGDALEGLTFQVCFALFKGANGKISMEVTRPKPTLRTEAPK
ncbi:inactivation-no-after-potential D protein isoform X1 [Drosophila guanche]|uniref:Blast:Inactivation-no-after-potential D protein n=2 Tax=Drosophila guanche TaxID=7266 RepID=A0A3B0JU98_DROGU|nr:inactivation-no-after-potential D protein isoform X1 [Drosophila guanche]SPP74648.1 blast:Inactivation-no-after-potential D protein [Drosophila guanche]